MVPAARAARTMVEALIWLFSLALDAFLLSIGVERVTIKRFICAGGGCGRSSAMSRKNLLDHAYAGTTVVSSIAYGRRPQRNDGGVADNLCRLRQAASSVVIPNHVRSHAQLPRRCDNVKERSDKQSSDSAHAASLEPPLLYGSSLRYGDRMPTFTRSICASLRKTAKIDAVAKSRPLRAKAARMHRI